MTKMELELAQAYRVRMQQYYPGEVSIQIIEAMRLKGFKITKHSVSKFWAGTVTRKHKFIYFNVIERLISKAKKEQEKREKKIQLTLNQN